MDMLSSPCAWRSTDRRNEKCRKVALVDKITFVGNLG
jgi:hypothetical protein